jgi:hypothetical protein
MDVFKLVLLALVRLATGGILKAALIVYIWSRPGAPHGGAVPPPIGHTGTAASTAKLEAGVAPTSRDAFFVLSRLILKGPSTREPRGRN